MEEPNVSHRGSRESSLEKLLEALEETAQNVLQKFDEINLLGIPLPSIVNSHTQKLWAESPDVSDALNRVHAYEDRLQGIEAQVSAVKRRLQLYRAQVNMSLGPPVGLLPVEILQKIFSYTRTRDEDFVTGFDDHSTTTVIHVCHFWREVALQYGILWSDIDMLWPEGKINCWARRATDTGYRLKLFAMVNNYKSYDLDGVHKEVYRLPKAFASLSRCHFPKIGEISLRFLSSVHPPRRTNKALYRCFKDVDLMHCLTSVNISLEDHDSYPIEIWRRNRPTVKFAELPLVSLTLKRAFATDFNSECLSILNLHSVSVSCEKWEDLLRSSPSLEVLWLSSVSAYDFNAADSTWKPPSDPIILKSLRSMNLWVYIEDNDFPLLLCRVVSAPYIQELTVAEFQSSECYVDALLLSYPTVKTLRIPARTTHVPVTRFLHLISGLAFIEELRILAKNDINEEFCRCLHVLSTRSPNPVPEGKALRQLHVPDYDYDPAILHWIKERVGRLTMADNQ